MPTRAPRIKPDQKREVVGPTVAARPGVSDPEPPGVYRATIKNWPADERPREKLMLRGAEALSDAELLAILIGSGTGKATALDLARDLVERHGSLRKVSMRSQKDLQSTKGIGPARAVAMLAAFELARRVNLPTSEEVFRITGPADVYRYIGPRLRDLKKERFYILLLNQQNVVIRDVQISEGSLSASIVHPREVFKEAIGESAACIVLIHNHPSGNPEPSGEDRAITRQLVDAGKLMGIPVHDHLIVAGDRFTSFAERGLL